MQRKEFEAHLFCRHIFMEWESRDHNSTYDPAACELGQVAAGLRPGFVRSKRAWMDLWFLWNWAAVMTPYDGTCGRAGAGYRHEGWPSSLVLLLTVRLLPSLTTLGQ